MKAIVQMEVEIPVGYELAEPMMRRPMTGDTYLGINGEIREAGHLKYNNDYPILKKKWEPEEGKWYMFSDYHEDVGSCSCPIGRLTAYNLAWEQPYRALGSRYSYCWPVPNEVELGE